MSVRINNNNFDEIVLKNEKTVLVDFYSDSCVSCKKLSPVLAELEENYGDKLVVGKINIVYDTQLAEQYQIKSVPTLVFFKNGTQKAVIRGVKDEEEIEDTIRKLL